MKLFQYKIHFLLFSIFFGTLGLMGYAQYLMSAPMKKIFKSDSSGLKIVENNFQLLHIVNNISSLEYAELSTTHGNFTELSVEGYGSSQLIGSPKLPVLHQLIEIPIEATVQIEIIRYKTHIYQLSDFGISSPLHPLQPPQSKSNKKKDTTFHFNSSVYKKNKFLNALSGNASIDSGLVSITYLGQLRGANLARLDIAQVQYNPVTNTIIVFQNLEIKLHFINGNIQKTINTKGKTNSLNFSQTYSTILNNQVLETKGNNVSSNMPLKYVIVADSIYKKSLQSFIKWKTKKGFQMIEAFTNDPAVGKTTTSIRNYLINLYNNATPNDPAPTYVLLVGNTLQIPSFVGQIVEDINTGPHNTDLYYGEYTNDFLPEVFYGRLPADDTLQLQSMIDKILHYENYQMTDPSYLANNLLIAGVDQENGYLMNNQLNYENTNYINSAHGINPLIYNYPMSASKAAEIITKFNNGTGFLNYTGHGEFSGFMNPSFQTSDIASLSNTDKYPVIISNACNTNIISKSQDGFGESIVKAKNKGALAYIGATDATYWDEDYYWSIGNKSETNPVYNSNTLGAFDRLFHDHGEPVNDWDITLGQIIQAGDLSVMKSGSTSADLYWEIYQLTGDPSLMVYMGIPKKLEAKFNKTFPIGSKTLTVETEPYAYVAISMNDSLYGASFTDSTGVANIPISAIKTIGYASIVITKQNRQPLIYSISIVAPDAPFIIYNDYKIDDSEGNNDGLIDNGEIIRLKINLKNYGKTADSNVIARLTTIDTNITILSDTGHWNILPSGQIVLQSDYFRFKVKNNVPDQHQTYFDIHAWDKKSNSWNSFFSVLLNAPSFEIGSKVINDSVGGNNNHRLDPGETIKLKILNTNIGHALAANTVYSLSTDNSSITINNPIILLDTLTAGSFKFANFSFSVDYSVEPGTNISFNYKISSGDYNYTAKIILPVGYLIEDFENFKSTHIPWDSTNLHPWIITDTIAYQLTHCAVSAKIKDSEASIMSVGFNVLFNDSISFYRKVSSELNFDILNFYIDNKIVGQWSGELDWAKVSFAVSQGNHLFKWVYQKDMSGFKGADRAWVDYIVFPAINNNTSINNYIINANNKISVDVYPNPANNFTNLNINLPDNLSVNIYLYDATGHVVRMICENQQLSKGIHLIDVETSVLTNGFYYIVLKTNKDVVTKKLLIIK